MQNNDQTTQLNKMFKLKKKIFSEEKQTFKSRNALKFLWKQELQFVYGEELCKSSKIFRVTHEQILKCLYQNQELQICFRGKLCHHSQIFHITHQCIFHY